MSKRKKSLSDTIAQPYDTTLKTWVKENPAEILPVLLPGAVYQESVDEEVVIFHFHTLPLFTLEAERYIQEHITCMYPLLPAMQGANAEVIAQAMTELAELYREDEVSLSQQFVWMELLLERTTTIPLAEKAKIQERIKMYDPLWEEHPKVKKIREESEVIGETKALQKAIIDLVKARFPNLVEEAQQKVKQVDSPDVLNFLLVGIGSAADETVALHILHPSAA